MGGGSFQPTAYKAVADVAKHSAHKGFSQSRMSAAFDPSQIAVRESCRSEINGNRDPISVVVGLDVTGSMGEVPRRLMTGDIGNIGQLMQRLLDRQAPHENFQLMFAGIGDVKTDAAPLQVTQFESDIRICTQMQQIWLEGNGGGNNGESYNLLWYFALHKTKLDSLQTGRRGILITMGDEPVHGMLTKEEILKIDPNYKGPDLRSEEILGRLTEKFDVYHLILTSGSYYQSNTARVNQCWTALLGENAILVSDYTKIVDKIVGIVDSHRVRPVLSDSPSEPVVVSSATSGVASVFFPAPQIGRPVAQFSEELSATVPGR